jgi:plastocyanin
MRHFLLATFVVCTACGGSSNSSATKLPAGTTVLDLHAGATGADATVRFGSFVAWRSADGLQHTIASASTPPAFPTTDVPAGDVSNAIAITPAGTYKYVCAIHGASETGSVHVLVPGS